MEIHFNIFISGFMGAGKSTFVERLGGLPFSYDLDHIIFKKYGMGFKNLGAFITKRGLEYFRELERAELAAFCSSHGPYGPSFVLSLGGGTLDQRGLELIRSNKKGLLVWIDTDFETCFERIHGDANRPLAHLEKNKLRELYNERAVFYAQSDIRLGPKEQREVRSLEDIFRRCQGPLP